ncbi:hypothetical protein ACRAWD_11385 [Caulobacter segnis]
MRGKAAPSPDVPIVMVGRAGRRRAVAHMNLAAVAEAGLRLGQAVAHATAMVSGLVLYRDLDADGDSAALHRLALWTQRHYSPTVAPDPPDGLVIDATGCDHLFGGEEKMLVDIRRRLAKAGYTVTVAIARQLERRPPPWRAGLRRAVFVAAAGGAGPAAEGPPRRGPAPATRSRPGPGQARLRHHSASFRRPRPRDRWPDRFGLEPIRRLDQAHAREQREPIEPVFAADTPRVGQDIRRADRRARDHGPLPDRTHRRAVRHPGSPEPGGQVDRRLVLSGRQPHRERPGGPVEDAGPRCATPGQAPLREAGDGRSRLWRRQDGVGRARRGTPLGLSPGRSLARRRQSEPSPTWPA